MNKKLTKEEILLLPDAQFLDWCIRVCPQLNKYINKIENKFILVSELKKSVSKYYHPKDKVKIIENDNLQIPIEIKTKEHSIFVEQPNNISTEHLDYDPIKKYSDIIDLDINWVNKNDELLKKNGDIVKLYTSHFDRKGELTCLAKEIVDKIILTIDQTEPYPDEICFYRGVKKNYEQSVLEKLKPKDEIIDYGFSSQTIDINVAYDFSLETDIYGEKDHGAIIMLCYPKNSKFLYLPIISNFPNEKEVLTYPNMKLVFIKKEIKNISEIDIKTRKTIIIKKSIYFFKVLYNDLKYIKNIKIDYDYDPKFLTFLDDKLYNYYIQYNDKYLLDWDTFYICDINKFAYNSDDLISIDCDNHIPNGISKIKPDLQFYNKQPYIKFYRDFVFKLMYPNITIEEFNKYNPKNQITKNTLIIPTGEKKFREEFDIKYN